MRSTRIWWTAALLLWPVSTSLNAHEQPGRDAQVAPLPRAEDYAFPLPTPGTYRLPPIKRAAGGSVLDERGTRHDLLDYVKGKVSLLSFIYTRCGDLCPTASLQLSLTQALLAKDPHLASRVRLVTMSFDPEHDTPDILRDYSDSWRSADRQAPEWTFLTAPSKAATYPVLSAYDQSVVERSDASSSGAPFAHIFRGFLIDRSGIIRNIYSMDFFEPALMIADVRTLILEEDQAGRVETMQNRLEPASHAR